MSIFSIALQNHIEHLGIKIYTLAKLSGVDRSHIHKMIKGQRIPADKNTLNKLIEAMRLTPYQADELKKLYMITRIGEPVYLRHMLVKNLLENMGKLPSKISQSIKTKYLHDFDSSTKSEVAYGTYDINCILKAVIELESAKPNGHIKIIAQSEHSFLMEILISVGINNVDLTITHVMRMQKNNIEDSENRYNLECISNIAPLIVSGCQYNPYCYYGNVKDITNTTSIMPYMIITSDSVVTLSHDLNYAALFHSCDFIKIYSSIYDDILNISKPMLTKYTTPMQLFKYYMEQESKGIFYKYSFFSEPCIMNFITESILDKYIVPDLPNREEILKLYLTRINTYRELYKNGHCFTSFFTEEGINQFVATGRVTDIPAEYYFPIEKNDRNYMIKIMYEYALQSSYNPIIIDTSKFKVPKNLVIVGLNEITTLMIYMHPVYGAIALILNEQSVAYSIYSFFQYLKDSDLVLSKEKTHDIITNILNENN